MRILFDSIRNTFKNPVMTDRSSIGKAELEGAGQTLSISPVEVTEVVKKLHSGSALGEMLKALGNVNSGSGTVSKAGSLGLWLAHQLRYHISQHPQHLSWLYFWDSLDGWQEMGWNCKRWATAWTSTLGRGSKDMTSIHGTHTLTIKLLYYFMWDTDRSWIILFLNKLSENCARILGRKSGTGAHGTVWAVMLKLLSWCDSSIQ